MGGREAMPSPINNCAEPELSEIKKGLFDLSLGGCLASG